VKALLTRAAAALGVLSLPLAAPLAGAHAAFDSSVVIGHVYVDDNTTGANTVAGFDQHPDGTLTPIPGSPFAVGGAGTGTGIGSQDALQLSADRRYLLAADAGSSQISILRIQDDGSLVPAPGSPVASGGNEPVSIAVRGPLVYVANTGAGGSNYTGFVLLPGGHLFPIPGSTVPVPDGSGLGDVLFNGTGTRLIGIRVNTSLIDSFIVTFGHLTAAPGSPFAAQAAGPFGSEFRPTNPSQLFVSNAHAGAGNGSVSAFMDGALGTLASIGASPYPDNQTAPCWVSISSDGSYLFTTNTASGSISRYAIALDGTLTLLGSTPLKNATTAHATELRLDAGGRYLYLVEPGVDAVGAFSVNGGSLAELAQSPFALPAGAAPFGLAVVGRSDQGDE
jgi:6-phosphogluconolactonase (cycloisomerase 2 family)